MDSALAVLRAVPKGKRCRGAYVRGGKMCPVAALAAAVDPSLVAGDLVSPFDDIERVERMHVLVETEYGIDPSKLIDTCDLEVRYDTGWNKVIEYVGAL